MPPPRAPRPPLLVLLVLLATPMLPALAAPAPDAGDAPAWEQLPGMPGARAESAAVVVGERIYVIGGVFDDYLPGISATEGRVDVYDVDAQTWSAAPPLPVSLNHLAAVAIGPRIYVLGGYYGVVFHPLALTWTLDTSLPAEEQQWEAWVPMPTPRGAHAAATDGRTIWVYGGIGAPGPWSLGFRESTNDRTVLKIDTHAENPAWELAGLFPDPRDHLAGAYHDGKIYAVGGRDLLVHLTTGRTDAMDVATGEWTRLADMPTPRGGLGAAVAGGKLVAVGGEDTTRAYHEVEALDLATGTWETLPSLPAGRHGVGVVAHDDHVYVEGGGHAPGYHFSTENTRLRVG